MASSPSQQIREQVLHDVMEYIVAERGEEILALDWAILNKLVEENTPFRGSNAQMVIHRNSPHLHGGHDSSG